MKLPLGVTTLHLSRRSLTLLFLAVALLGVGGYGYVQQERAIDDAVAVRATVDAAEVDRISSRRSVDYEPDIEYTYRYRGETYTSDRVFPGPGVRTYSDRSKARAVVDAHESGETVRAYVRPSAPEHAFLIRERAPWPVQALGLGVVLMGVVVLAGVGERNPGRYELRPAEPWSPQTWVERNGETLRRVSKRSLVVCFVAFWLSIVGLVVGVLSLTGGDGSGRPVEAALVGPVGVALLTGLGSWVGMILSLCVYGIWSFGRYRRLRRRLPEPRPPSPFRRPNRLVSILGTNSDDLPEYGRRVRLTGWAFVIATAMAAVAVRLFYTAA